MRVSSFFHTSAFKSKETLAGAVVWSALFSLTVNNPSVYSGCSDEHPPPTGLGQAGYPAPVCPTLEFPMEDSVWTRRFAPILDFLSSVLSSTNPGRTGQSELAPCPSSGCECLLPTLHCAGGHSALCLTLHGLEFCACEEGIVGRALSAFLIFMFL